MNVTFRYKGSSPDSNGS